MLRHSHRAILCRPHWDAFFSLDKSVCDELEFWFHKVQSSNFRLLNYTPSVTRIVYSDASNSGCGGFIVDVHGSHRIRNWSAAEAKMSSAWRELKAVSVVLSSVKHMLKDHNVRWYSDNQSVVSIVKKGSMKSHLHSLAISIHKTCIQSNINLMMEWIPGSLNE